MGLVTRLYGPDAKGSKLTIEEMDNNLYYLQSSNKPIEHTFAELLALRNAGSLLSGSYYKMTDYQTVYDQPDYDGSGTPKEVVSTLTGSVEPLILFAVNRDSFAEHVWSSDYPQDYILYDPNFTSTEVMLAPAKGRIIQRMDENRNVTGYDHRNVLLKRYESEPESGIFNVINDNGGAYAELSTFGIGCETINISYIREEEAGYDDPVFIVSNNIFGEGCEEVYCGQDFYNNTIGDNCYGISFNHWCHNNLIGNGFVNNHIGNEFSFNTIGNNFSSNRIGNMFQNNTIGNDFISNAIGNDFGSGTGNTIGDGFYSNIIEDQFAGNKIKNSFMHNYVNDYFQNTLVQDNFQHNDIKVGIDGTESWPTQAYAEAYTHVVNGFNTLGEVDYQRYMGWFQSNLGAFTYTGL